MYMYGGYFIFVILNLDCKDMVKECSQGRFSNTRRGILLLVTLNVILRCVGMVPDGIAGIFQVNESMEVSP